MKNGSQSIDYLFFSNSGWLNSADKLPPPAAAVTSVEAPQAAVATPAAAETTSPNSIPMEQEDLDKKSVKEGYGLAAGTTNTYIIPGMLSR